MREVIMRVRVYRDESRGQLKVKSLNPKTGKWELYARPRYVELINANFNGGRYPCLEGSLADMRGWSNPLIASYSKVVGYDIHQGRTLIYNKTFNDKYTLSDNKWYTQPFEEEFWEVAWAANLKIDMDKISGSF
jgi:hypothetical protein